jgi:hypothetical protein
VDYGTLLGDSWRVAWRHKYLWVLGLFAFGGSCSSSPSFNVGSEDLPTGSGETGDLTGVADFISEHSVLLLGLLAAFLLLGLVLFVISFLATAGLIAGVDEAHAGRRSGLGFAWRRGVASFWRLLGLLLLLAVAGAVVLGLLLLLLVVPAVLAFASDGSDLTGPLIALVLLGVLLVLLLIPVGIAVQIILNWALRSLVLESSGILASLGAGWRLFRRNLGTSLVLWILDVALNIGLGLLLAVPLLAAAVPVIMGGLFFDEVGLALLAGGLLLGLVLLAAFALFKAVSSTFFAAYWTIAYRRLTGGAGEQLLEPTPPRSGPITVAPPPS